jgi:cytochrome o ubiquinol oxidase subunit IV
MASHAHTNAHANSHGDHAHHDDHHHGEHVNHGSFGSYMTGFILSVILTAIPFWLVMGDVIADKTVTAVLIMGLGLVQIVVHMIFFLHMDTKSEGGWNMMALLFTVVLVLIALSGSLWVMHNLNVNMMPPLTIDGAKQLP